MTRLAQRNLLPIITVVVVIGGIAAGCLRRESAPAIEQASTAKANTAPAADESKAAEVAYWNSVDKSDVKQLEAYLNKYPDGQFKELANLSLAKLGRTVILNSVDPDSDVSTERGRARLDNFAASLSYVPTASAWILAYGGRRGRRHEAQTQADHVKNYLVKSRGIDPSRIVTVDAGYREKLTVELWVVPAGAVPPAASPNVDPSEVQIVK
jgi:outer membrane protein OmpA-like peptidoglycan-associated protein